MNHDGDLAEDLSTGILTEALPDREIRSYPALLSTEADALAWARGGAPEGALVVADYQASPRGRGGQPWEVRPGQGLCFSMVLRPELAPAREGWLYTVGISGVADLLAARGTDPGIVWPDEVRTGGDRAGALGVHVELGPDTIRWAVATFLLVDARPPRAPLLADLVAAVERRGASPPDEVLDDYRDRCMTLGMQVRARLVPMGPAGPEVVGRADDCLEDGALVIETARGSRVAVPPRNLGLLEEAL